MREQAKPAGLPTCLFIVPGGDELGPLVIKICITNTEDGREFIPIVAQPAMPAQKEGEAKYPSILRHDRARPAGAARQPGSVEKAEAITWQSLA
jgi:hypothetical protein